MQSCGTWAGQAVLMVREKQPALQMDHLIILDELFPCATTCSTLPIRPSPSYGVSMQLQGFNICSFTFSLPTIQRSKKALQVNHLNF